MKRRASERKREREMEWKEGREKGRRIKRERELCPRDGEESLRYTAILTFQIEEKNATFKAFFLLLFFLEREK